MFLIHLHILLNNCVTIFNCQYFRINLILIEILIFLLEILEILQMYIDFCDRLYRKYVEGYLRFLELIKQEE